MTALPSHPTPDESPAAGPEIARFGDDRPFGATDHPFATDAVSLPSPSAVEEVR